MINILINSKIKKFFPPVFHNIVTASRRKVLLKSIKEEFELAALRKQVKNSGFPVSNHKKILFYPKFPLFGMGIYKICRIMGYRMVYNPKEKVGLVMNWQGDTFGKSDYILDNLAKKYTVINYNCNEISKEKVDRVFKEVFGYSAMLDPLKFNGDCVVKSNFNATHDGRVIKCPINKKEEGVVYQKVINNQLDNDYVQDIRVPVFKNKIPIVYLKFRSINDRFAHPKKTIGAKPDEILSEEEIGKITLFSEKIGLDYGEIDVLRDRGNGLIYIVDANPTPWNPDSLPKIEKRETFKILAKAFDDVFMGCQRESLCRAG